MFGFDDVNGQSPSDYDYIRRPQTSPFAHRSSRIRIEEDASAVPSSPRKLHTESNGDTSKKPQRGESFESLEAARMSQRFRMYGVKEKRKIEGDGNCQFAAVSDQLFGHPKFHPKIRKVVAHWLRNHPHFAVDSTTVLSDFLEKDCFPTWNAYCDYVAEEGNWGDQITLRAIAEIFNVEITVISSVDTPEPNSQPITTIRPANGSDFHKSILLAHWHERHYGSLTVVDEESEEPVDEE